MMGREGRGIVADFGELHACGGGGLAAEGFDVDCSDAGSYSGLC